MCTVVLKTHKNVQTDSEVLKKLRTVQNLLCFICFYQTYTIHVFTVVVFRDLSVFMVPKIRPTLLLHRSFNARYVMTRYHKISKYFVSGFIWC
jgi:hypothetical protein